MFRLSRWVKGGAVYWDGDGGQGEKLQKPQILENVLGYGTAQPFASSRRLRWWEWVVQEDLSTCSEAANT